MVRTQSDRKQTQLQKETAHFWTKPAASVSCAVLLVRDKEVFVESLQFSMAGRGQLVVVRRCGESTLAQLSLHNSSVLSAAFHSCLCILPEAPLEDSTLLF